MSKDAGRRGAVGQHRGGRVRPLPGDPRRRRLVRAPARDRGPPLHARRARSWSTAPTASCSSCSGRSCRPRSCSRSASSRRTTRTRRAIAGVIAGVVAMIPEGLVLLTSLAFAVAAVTLARRRVLVQELPAVEGLARVDVVRARQDGNDHRRRHALRHARADRPTTTSSPTRSARSRPTSIATRRCRRCARRSRRRPDGRAPRRCRSRRRASGARRRSASAARGCSARPRWCGSAGRPTIRFACAFEALAAEGRRVLLLARSDAALVGEALPERARGGGVRAVRRADPRRRRRHDPVLRASRA